MTDTSTPTTQDAPSFADELEKLLPDLRGFAWSLCRNSALADDLVQDACIKAWTASQSLKPGLSIKPWVFQILRNEWRQHQRRAWRTQLVESEEIERSLVTESNAEALADSLKASDAIYNLPEAHRDAAILVLAAGMTYGEAADVLGCSAGTVKSRLSRARQMLVIDLDRGVKSATAPDETSPHQSGGLEKLAIRANALIEMHKRVA